MDLHIMLVENKIRIQKLKKTTADSGFIYQDELGKACFQQEDFKDLPRRTPPDKVLRDEAFAKNIAKNPKNDGYQSVLTLMGYKCLDKKFFDGVLNVPLLVYMM